MRNISIRGVAGKLYISGDHNECFTLPKGRTELTLVLADGTTIQAWNTPGRWCIDVVMVGPSSSIARPTLDCLGDVIVKYDCPDIIIALPGRLRPSEVVEHMKAITEACGVEEVPCS